MWEIVLPRVVEKTTLRRKLGWDLKNEKKRTYEAFRMVIPAEEILDINSLVHFFKVQMESIAGCEINLESSLDHANYEGHG